MAVAQIAPVPPPPPPQPQQQQHEGKPRRKPFAQIFKNLASFNKNRHQDEREGKSLGKKTSGPKNKKNGGLKNNPYPESGAHLHRRGRSPSSSVADGQLTPTSRVANGSSTSLAAARENEAIGNGNKSRAPTVATNPETIHSDAGHSKAATHVTTNTGATSADGAGEGSTFSSPSQSERSLTTTLTTVQSTAAGNALNSSSGAHAASRQSSHGTPNHPNPVMFSHQYPVSPAPSNANTISAIPRHVAESHPNTYDRATANGLLTDNASILTLASSSKRRRRSYETDASVRALAPSSVWGGSRESLPLSVLSGGTERAERDGGERGGFYAPSRPSIGGLASAERASVYSSSGVAAPALASERNSYYSKYARDPADAKSLRSITNIDARSIAADARSLADTRSIGGGNTDGKSVADARSTAGDAASLKNYESSVRSGAFGHGRDDSLSGSINSPVLSSLPAGVLKQRRSASGAHSLSRRSSDWAEIGERDDGADVELERGKRVESPIEAGGRSNDEGDATNQMK